MAKIKTLWKARKGIVQVKEAYVKNGIKTTEFWLTALTAGQLMFESYKGNIDPKWASVISACLVLGFAITRALTKAAASLASVPTTPDK